MILTTNNKRYEDTLDNLEKVIINGKEVVRCKCGENKLNVISYKETKKKIKTVSSCYCGNVITMVMNTGVRK